ncbi:hypothetical protein AVEN_125262-1 [Araneus ventricosus]|uniref:Uncharacterized protein n=1 Tax=Araneus ventricosus TaxID=182803 RepID=A0A4Y2GB14_ARAVE|nr:hypothetical protein AVEN_125262-1 [Araneus ventricosus]
MPAAITTTRQLDRTSRDYAKLKNAGPCHVPAFITATEPVGWTWDYAKLQNAGLCHVPAAITATEPVGWTWDYAKLQNAGPCHVPAVITATEPVGWTWDAKLQEENINFTIFILYFGNKPSGFFSALINLDFVYLARVST